MTINKESNPISIYKDINYGLQKPAATLLLETSTVKEIRIILSKGVLMADHKSPFPIVIHIQEGAIELTVAGTVHAMSTGDLIGLESAIVHNLKATENSIIRLSIHKHDAIERVQNVINTD